MMLFAIVLPNFQDLKVTAIEHEDDSWPKSGSKLKEDYKKTAEVVIRKIGCYMTSLILMGYGIRFAQALANVDLDYVQDNLSESVIGFGSQGKVKYP